ncbi:uncharacterized protein N7498_004250 [Penicillium cinerascens]|uniref:Aldehyde dehydrogenase domain-containing protein n=1 Tax=Penicillium cinerascens TaxID=70096 RepID=A0A9W9N4H0_9EURO|nr:uncharacterized protein N7498_004250 [Penicillium cinerascens]KAJ5212604.1 hypothetical protein N7498_004250 [Penicillium cinerascens]
MADMRGPKKSELAIVDAVKDDLDRSDFETYLTDLADARTADEPTGDSFVASRLGAARIWKEPLGVVLIVPLITAITSSCCAVVKPPELIVACQNLLQDLVTRYLDSTAVRVVRGGVRETTKLLELPLNYIFFTGSASVDRHISAAAAKHLTPVALELGGQSAAITGQSADVDRAANSVAHVKFLNAGQICFTSAGYCESPKVVRSSASVQIPAV